MIEQTLTELTAAINRLSETLLLTGSGTPKLTLVSGPEESTEPAAAPKAARKSRKKVADDLDAPADDTQDDVVPADSIVHDTPEGETVTTEDSGDGFEETKREAIAPKDPEQVRTDARNMVIDFRAKNPTQVARHKSDLSSILAKYGVASISAVKDEDLADMLDLLTEICA
jgi:hypothetical protein